MPLFLQKKKTIMRQWLKLECDSIAETVRGNYKAIVSPPGLVTKILFFRIQLGISFIALKKL
jgi:hypothetical protein